MESLPSVSPSSMSIVLPISSNNSALRMKTVLSCCPPCKRSFYPPLSAISLSSSNGSRSRRMRRRPLETASCRSSSISGSAGGGEDAAEEEEGDDFERALHMDGRIPRSSDQFVKQVSSRAYNMRRHLQQSIDCSSYDGAFLFLLLILLFFFMATSVEEFQSFRFFFFIRIHGNSYHNWLKMKINGEYAKMMI